MKRLFPIIITAGLFLLFLLGGRHIDAASDLSGKVIETMDSGGYSYVCLENSGNKIWVAVPQMKIQNGKTMAFQPGVEMVNFESKTLKRTFDKIIFSTGPAK
ncbi:MAG: hypothetical protein HY755_04500 [Nitrospirae bacterium]|nr:hypothetical protein [Nitrospirota bacterium]